MKYILIIALAFLIGCSTTKTKAPVDAPPVIVENPVEEYPKKIEIIPEKKYSASWDSKAGTESWTSSLERSLHSSGLALYDVKIEDAAEWCPKYNSLNTDEKTQFYVMLISTMAKRESNFKPETSYKEGFNDSKGNPVISRGLLQISKESANQKAYGCSIQSEQELHDVETNLRCGVKILNHWISKDRKIASSEKGFFQTNYTHYGAARYWSVARSSSSSKAVLTKATNSLSFCK